MRSTIIALSIGAFLSGLFTPALADEGMWQPKQLNQLAPQLKQRGLQLAPSTLSDLDKFPMNAIVSLGGCSASFVSPQGLVVTNHHCVYGSIQHNSTAENNLFENGFLASSLDKEVPAAPGSKIYVTENVTNVTDKILANIDATASGLERYNAIEAHTKTLIAQCESSGIHRCSVTSFHHGLEYNLIKKLEIKDVRLVYAPASSIGKYGGDIDNWQWPRHTGDFGFYRAYVNKQGKPAEYSQDNVPYTPPSFLKVNQSGINNDDFVMAIGYPGRTNRYRTADEIRNKFTWSYPHARQLRETLIEIIQANTSPGSPERLAYESQIARLANYAKNFKSMEEAFNASDFLQRAEKREADLSQWVNSSDTKKQQYGETLTALRALVSAKNNVKERELVLGYMYYSNLTRAAEELYRLAKEKQKPDSEREPGYQQRDISRFKQSMQRLSKQHDNSVDKAILSHLLGMYADLPEAQKLSAFSAFFGIDGPINAKKLSKKLDKMYRKTRLTDESIRLAWMDKSVAEFEQSKDPFIQFAVAVYEDKAMLEKAEKTRNGQFQRWRPRYMEAIIAYNRDLGLPIYADANSSLRVSYGKVSGNQPKDGLLNLPFTQLEGILAKNTGNEPFNAPAQQLDLIRQKTYGPYAHAKLGSVPVNFLATLDITGGNSGTATLNAKAELVGVLFDGVYESIIGDWDFDDEKNRAISVDVRYMLWVMKYVDKADNLLNEMHIVH